MTIATLTRDNAALTATVERFRTQREELRTKIDGLEAEVARLESEGLTPLIDRLRDHIRVMKETIDAMEAKVEDLEAEAAAS